MAAREVGRLSRERREVGLEYGGEQVSGFDSDRTSALSHRGEDVLPYLLPQNSRQAIGNV